MRALLLTSIGVACAGALLLPLAPTHSADFTLSDKHAASADDAVPPADTGSQAHGRTAGAERAGSIPGRTQSLALGAPGDSTRSGDQLLSAWEDDPAGGKRIASRKVKPFSLVGVIWNDARVVPQGRLQVQTRASGTGRWSAWQSLNTHDDDRPDRDARERSAGRILGATAPVWVGNSSAVRVRVMPARGSAAASPKPSGRARTQQQQHAQPQLPAGARLELVDPGPDEPKAGSSKTGKADDGGRHHAGKGAAGGKHGSAKRPGGVLPALSKAETRATYGAAAAKATPSRKDRAKDTRIGPRPGIITRKGWGADEGMRESAFLYTNTVKAAFVHHTAETNNYTCAQAPSIIRGIYRYHVKSSHWRDIGYNFLIDKCGKIYEGRAGGVARAVMGAHTYGFNTDTTGIAVLGTYSKTEASKAATESIAELAAWKLGIHGVDANGKVMLTSGGGTKYTKGSKVAFHAISGHRDGYVTECPGDALYHQLPAIRDEAARLQGR